MLSKYGANVQQMQNVVLEAREASVAKLVIDSGVVYNIKEIVSKEIIEGAKGAVLGVEMYQ